MSSNLILSAIRFCTSLEGAAGVAGDWSRKPGDPPKTRSGFDPSTFLHVVHVRQIRLAAAVRKTAAFEALEVQILPHAPEFVCVFIESGVEKWPISLPS